MERSEGDRRVISEEDLQQLIREDENIAWLEKFELGGRSLLNRNSDRAFRFSHYTIQEFLLAWGLVNEQLVGEEPLRVTEQLIRFIDLADGVVGYLDQIILPEGFVLPDAKSVKEAKVTKDDHNYYMDWLALHG
jgi:hypothetical protein